MDAPSLPPPTIKKLPSGGGGDNYRRRGSIKKPKPGFKPSISGFFRGDTVTRTPTKLITGLDIRPVVRGV